MVTDKDREALIDDLRAYCDGWCLEGKEPLERLKTFEEAVRAESAEQARKEAADRVCRICRIISKPQCLRDTDCMTRMAILSPLQNVGNGEQVPSERNKLEIAVKTLEYFATYSGCEASGLDMRDMAEETLKEIQG